MWYATNDRFVRAPAPLEFDQLIQNLEDRDSVIFESISLPSASRLKLEVEDPIVESELDLSDDVCKMDWEEPSAREVQSLRNRLIELEMEGARKTDEIVAKDNEIRKLKSCLLTLQNGHSPTPVRDESVLLDFYKTEYESALLEMENLKKSLQEDGKLRRVSARAARPVTPRLM
jgi:hypothetical protein